MEEAWSNGSMAEQRGVAGEVDRREREKEVAAMVDAEPEVADFGPWIAQADARTVEGGVARQGEAIIVHAPEIPLTESERARIRKGKGLLLERKEPSKGGNFLKSNYGHSGSDSCEPIEQEPKLWVQLGPLFSEDAASGAGAVVGQISTKPNSLEAKGEGDAGQGIVGRDEDEALKEKSGDEEESRLRPRGVEAEGEYKEQEGRLFGGEEKAMKGGRGWRK